MSLAGRLARPTLAAAGISAGYLTYASYSSPLLAEDAASRAGLLVRPGRTSTGDKLPIYPTSDSEPLVTLIETHNPITPFVAQARESTTSALSTASQYVERGVSKWISFERTAEHEIKSILPKDESLTPGLIYVLVAGLSGSVLTRTRAFPIRWLTPPLFTLIAMPYFLPKTAHNLRNYLSEFEDKHFPEFAMRHDQFNSNAETHTAQLFNRVGNWSKEANKLGDKAMRGIEDSTGLKVGDLVKKAERERARVEEKVQIGSEPVPVKTVGYVVESRPVAEIVAPVTEAEQTGAAAGSKPVAPGKRMV